MSSYFPLDFTPQCPHLKWMVEHLGGWQFGEQDLLFAVAGAIGLTNSVAEIGAGDGEKLPLTIERFYSAGFRCVLFEADDERQERLAKKYPIAQIEGEYREQSLPCFGLVVIDIDGHDSQVMQQVMKRDRPAIVVCEHMDRHYPVATSAPSPFPVWSLGHELTNGFRIQDTAETLQWMASQLGYERFGHNRCNSFFVRQDRYVDLFR